MKTAAAYIRVSTEDQTEYSPDSQLKQIREYAKRNDILLLEKYIFSDEGISGKNTKHREAFNLMIGIAKQKPKPFDIILVWKYSRFARNREDSIVYKSMLRKQCDIQVVSISESLGDDKTSILIEALIEAMDEYYSINLAEEVRRGMTEKASRGGVVSIPSFGYDIINGVYIPNSDAEIVQNIFDEFISGSSYRSLALKYSSLGIKTRRGNTLDNRFIEYLLHNPVYIGKTRWSKNGIINYRYSNGIDNPDIIIVNGTHKPIISDDTYNRAQDRIAQLKQQYGKYQRKSQPVQYMLKGLVRCSNCDSTLIRVQTKNPTLQCHKYAKGSCSISHSITIKKANDAVISALQNSITNNSFNIIPKPPQKSRTMDYDKIIDNEYAKLKRAKTAYLNGADTIEEYKQNKNTILNNINELQEQIKEEIPQINLSNYSNKVNKVLEIITDNKTSEEAKNTALRTIISKIIFNKSYNNIELHYY